MPQTLNATKSHSDSGGFDKKLIAYALAGGAALAAPAHASIIHYGGPTLTSTSSSTLIDIAVDGVDYYFAGSTVTGTGIVANGWASPANPPTNKLSVLFSPPQANGGLSGPLRPGQPVTGPFITDGVMAPIITPGSPGALNEGNVHCRSVKDVGIPIPQGSCSVTSIAGPVPNGVDTYLGLELPVNGQTNYGWILLNARIWSNQNAAHGEVEVLDYAYQSTPGAGILAGQTSDATPEPSTLALFALGAVGVAAVRRRRAKSA